MLLVTAVLRRRAQNQPEKRRLRRQTMLRDECHQTARYLSNTMGPKGTGQEHGGEKTIGAKGRTTDQSISFAGVTREFVAP